MLKVFGFVRRHAQLSHDEYRAAHVGYHNSFGRRLNGIRGYLLNVRANRRLEDLLGEFNAALNQGASTDFDEAWNGYGQLMFDSLDAYLQAKRPARDKPGSRGLEYDQRVAAVGGDAPYLYRGPPVQFQVVEHVVVAVRRAEHKILKLVLFAKRRPDLHPMEFQARWTGAYCALARSVPGLLGCIVNFPTDLDVMTGFFSEDSGAFEDAARHRRNTFLKQFDGIGEYWFRDENAFLDWRRRADRPLRALERALFATCFLREVDETVAVLPDRRPPAGFYHR